MNKKIVVVACLMVMTTVFTGCNLPGSDKTKEGENNNSNIEQNQESNKESDEENSESGSGDGNYFETMTDLMERGKSMKCTYTQEVKDSGTATGVVYMADKNARVEITVSSGGKMYSITDNKWTYSWNEGSSKGYKMTLEAAELDKKMKEEVSDLSKDINFSCKSWKKDSSKFKAPSNIVFEDLSEMMGGLEDMPSQEEMEAEANKMICELCKNAPALEMEECLGDVVCDWSE